MIGAQYFILCNIISSAIVQHDVIATFYILDWRDNKCTKDITDSWPC